MTEQEKRQRRVCFTGHRPEKLTRSEAEIRQELSAVLKVPVITSNQCVIDFVRECCEQNA